MPKPSNKFAFDTAKRQRDQQGHLARKSADDRLRQFKQRQKFNFLAPTTRGQR